MSPRFHAAEAPFRGLAQDARNSLESGLDVPGPTRAEA